MNIHQPICCPPLPDTLGGMEEIFGSSVGAIYYVMAGSGPPLLLIHGINAGASNDEWRENFQRLSRSYRVYAPDLPGFARSDKKPVIYTAALYIQAIIEFIIHVVREPVFILASGLSAAYTSFVAWSRPDLVKALALVTPSGINNNASPPCESSLTIFGIFTSPIQGDAVYNTFVSKPGIAYFLREFIYTDPKQVTAREVEVLYHSSHQCPNAKYAPASFVAGLSNLNIAPFWGEIRQPVLILWGALAKLNPVQNLQCYLQLNPGVESYVFPDTGLIPQVEKAEEFNEVIRGFFRSIS